MHDPQNMPAPPAVMIAMCISASDQGRVFGFSELAGIESGQQITLPSRQFRKTEHPTPRSQSTFASRLRLLFDPPQVRLVPLSHLPAHDARALIRMKLRNPSDDRSD